MEKLKKQRTKEGPDYDTIIQKSRPDPIYIQVVINEVDKDNWGIGGTPASVKFPDK